MQRDLPICQSGYPWWTIATGIDEAYGGWVKLGPVILCWFEWKGQREFELHTNNWLLWSSI